MKFSIIIPARDEEKLIGRCLDAIGRAAKPFPGDVEVIVVINRCTDRTEDLARSRGARIVHDDSRSLAAIRNAGARAATGEIIVTIDADSVMSDNMLVEVDRALKSGRYVGGGVPVFPERWSAGIFCSWLFLLAAMTTTRLTGGLYWCRRADFEAIGGFNEKLLVAEDLDFAHRMKRHGRARGLRLGVLKKTRIITSCRKFDRFGDWFFLKMLLLRGRELRRIMGGRDRTFADRYFYDFPH